MCLLAISLAGCNEANLGGSVMAFTDDSKDSLGVRAGVTADRLELGGYNYRDRYDDANSEWGTYGLIHLAPKEFIDPYIGGQSPDLFEEHFSLLAGMIVGPGFVEWRPDTNAFLLGTRIGF